MLTFYILKSSKTCPIINLGTFIKVSSVIRQRRQWHPTPALLPGKSHGRRSLVGCSPWGREESDTTERLHFHFSLSCTGEGNGTPLQCSCLENPRDGGAWWAAVYGVAQNRTRLKWLSSSSSVICKNLIDNSGWPQLATSRFWSREQQWEKVLCGRKSIPAALLPPHLSCLLENSRLWRRTQPGHTTAHLPFKTSSPSDHEANEGGR